MSIVSILYQQQNVIVNAKDQGSFFDQVKAKVLNPWSAISSRGITVDATVNEEHNSNAKTTDNPIEDGASVVDHVQIEPKILTIEGVISDSPLGFPVIGNIQNVVRTVTTLFGKSSRSIDGFNELVKLQETRTPFTVITGLKRYENMIMEELSVPRTSQTGRAIHFRAKFKQIIIVSSKSISVANNKIASTAKKTASATVDKGKVPIKEVAEPQPYRSTLFNLIGKIGLPSFGGQ